MSIKTPSRAIDFPTGKGRKEGIHGGTVLVSIGANPPRGKDPQLDIGEAVVN
ncbi:MAG: hypothetical protein WAV47_19145 [Blastocatellia bacterium]